MIELHLGGCKQNNQTPEVPNELSANRIQRWLAIHFPEYLAPTGSLNMTSIPLKAKQKTTALKVSGLASGDYVKAYTSSNKKILPLHKKVRLQLLKPGTQF